MVLLLEIDSLDPTQEKLPVLLTTYEIYLHSVNGHISCKLLSNIYSICHVSPVLLKYCDE